MKVLLHICCGVCAAGAIEQLIAEGHEVKGYFYNPNIYPQEEYEKRLLAARQATGALGIELLEGLYTTSEWDKATELYKDEPEGGKRCNECFRFRLQGTYSFLPFSSCDVFTSTLTISPHKPAAVINPIGQEIGGDKFLIRDFKKKDGFRRTNILSRAWNIYRQEYCGCKYSIRKD